MNNNKFLEDLGQIYNYLDEQKSKTNELITHLENEEYDKLAVIDEFAQYLDLQMTNDLRFALITRLVSLRDDSLTQVLKKEQKDEKQIIQIQEKAYDFVRKYWENKHKNTVEYIKENNLLTPFYQAVFEGVYNVGLKMSLWQKDWTAHIINGINKELLAKFNGDEAKVYEYLENNKLYDLGHNNIVADRCYSTLIKEKGEYKSKAYIKAFKQQTTAVINELENFEEKLIELEDNIFSEKWNYILYIQSLIKAFGEDKENSLVQRWADVDRAWMKIKTPIQIGHPLEYYEDHFRKAVALEWDIRLSNPQFVQNDYRVTKIKAAFASIFDDIEQTEEYKKTYDFSLKSLDKVQLYIGRPALFFGAEFNGLFSAQVVPNDEIVSKEEGKKIFAFSDEILQTSKARPFLKISKEIFGQEFLKEDRTFLFNETVKWHQVYDITTIGHEFGHILWCDDENETAMNKTGNFKNIEEFKATTGGLISFFLDKNSDEKKLEKQVLIDTIKRAVGLIAWMEVDEVQPYYCEGLIHLNALFECKILDWDEKELTIDMSDEKYQELKKWYIQTYKKLAKHYLDKKDATEFLNIYAKKEKNSFMPVDENIKSFVKYYYKRYQEIGQELDNEDKKSNYIK